MRLVRAEGVSSASLEALANAHGARLEITAPRFEDAFIDLLGGGPDGRSVIAERMAPVDTTRATMVECRHLTRRFGDFTATDDVSFDVRTGEVFGLLGPNGAGKSTTFKMLCGLLSPTSGSAEVAGVDLARAPGRAKAQLGYMAQKFSLYGLLSVRQNLDFFSGAYGLTGRLRDERIDEMIDTFELGPILDESPDDLPLGFRQRLALACSLMHRPSVLFLDEPTAGVDPVTRREFWAHISGLVAKRVTILVTTHFMDEAEYCDRVGLVQEGRLVELDTPDALKAKVRGEDLPEPTMEDAFIRLVAPPGGGGGSIASSAAAPASAVRPTRDHAVGRRGGALLRMVGLVRKESIQITRDPAALLIAFVLPVVLLFLFAFAVSLDVERVPFGVVAEGEGPAARELVAAYEASDWLDVHLARDRREVAPAVVAGDLRGFVVIPADIESRLAHGTSEAVLQIVTDGSVPSTANVAAGYARGIYLGWLAGRLDDTGAGGAPTVALEQRFRFNPELESRRVLLPGAIAIVMTMIGTLLTALVVAREWERGTMEALMSTPGGTFEILLSKLVPYFALGLITTLVCTGLCMTLFGLPLHGSWLALLLLSSAFLLPALGQGLLISTLAKNQFIAAQFALLTAFLPAFLLSGVLFEIASMPAIIRAITTIVAARWYVEGLQTVFLAGDVWPLLIGDIMILLGIGTVFVGVSVARSGGTLDR